jgi:FixJ family two-component response regulator
MVQAVETIAQGKPFFTSRVTETVLNAYLAQRAQAHHAEVMHKLKLNSLSELVRYAIRNGLCGKDFVNDFFGFVYRVNQDCRAAEDKVEAPTFDALTARERQVMQLLAEGKNNKEVATILDISTRTVPGTRFTIWRVASRPFSSGMIRSTMAM